MNHALQSYTPTVRPLNYDSLAARDGCEADTGNDILGSLAFTNVCVFVHDASNKLFNKLDKISYSVGPETQGVTLPLPHVTSWAAWSSSAGIRIDRTGAIIQLPASNTGVASALFPSSTTTKVTHAFNVSGLLHIAIEKEQPGFIQLRYYKNAEGEIGDLSFSGKSPLLFNYEDVDPSGSAGVVLYYVRPERQFKLYARFSQEAFLTEHEVMPDLRVNLVRLLSIRSIGNIVKLYAIDDTGRDVTLTSPPYPVRFRDKSKITTSILSGILTQIAIDAEPTSSKSKIEYGLEGGSMVDATAETATIQGEKPVFTFSIESGTMTQV